MNNALIPLDKHAVRRSFNQAAATYDEAALLQREVATRLLARLDLVKLEPQWILDAGSGTGFSSRALNKRYPKAQVLALDCADAMLRRARKNKGWFAKQSFACGDVECLPLQDHRFDLIVSSLSLQWCNDLDAVFAEFARVLKPGGLLMFSSFGPDTLKELRRAFRQVDGAGAHVSDFIDMHDMGDALVRNHFEMPVMDMEQFTLTYPDVRALMRDLKRIGAHNASTERPRGLMTPRRLQALSAAYEAFRRDGVLPASYEVVYGHAWAGTRPENRKLADGRVAVPLSQLRRGR